MKVGIIRQKINEELSEKSSAMAVDTPKVIVFVICAMAVVFYAHKTNAVPTRRDDEHDPLFQTF